VRRVADRLREARPRIRLGGFTTEEIRDTSGRRTGFRGETFEGLRVVIARAGAPGPRVGKYGVDVTAVDRLSESLDPHNAEVVLLDEIGKMECLSDLFLEAVWRLLETPVPLLATVARRGGGLIAEVKQRGDVELLEVTRENRDRLPPEVADRLGLTPRPPADPADRKSR